MKIKYIFFAVFFGLFINIINVNAETVECNNNLLLVDGIEKQLAGINYETINKDFCSYLDTEMDVLEENNKVFLFKDGELINKNIVEGGIAKVSKTSNITMNSEMCTSEYEAMKNRTGVWSNNYTDTECLETDYVQSNNSRIITSDNKEYSEKWGIKEGFSFRQLLIYILVGVIGIFIIVFRLKTINAKLKRHK